MPEVRKGSGGRSGAPAPLLAWAGRPATFLSLSAASGRKVVQYTNGGVEQVGGEELACLWLNPARKRLILSHVNKRRKKNCAPHFILSRNISSPTSLISRSRPHQAFSVDPFPTTVTEVYFPTTTRCLFA